MSEMDQWDLAIWRESQPPDGTIHRQRSFLSRCEVPKKKTSESVRGHKGFSIRSKPDLDNSFVITSKGQDFLVLFQGPQEYHALRIADGQGFSIRREGVGFQMRRLRISRFFSDMGNLCKAVFWEKRGSKPQSLESKKREKKNNSHKEDTNLFEKHYSLHLLGRSHKFRSWQFIRILFPVISMSQQE
jgi:hypothetical protein